MSEANFNLPNIFEDTNMNDASIRQIKNYLYQLTEQLKYMMNNIDSDNMTASYQDSIKRAVEAAEKVDTMSEVLETNLGITNRVLNERATQILEFNDLICKSLGLFKTEVTQEDGSVKYYMHDQSTLETSNTIYTLTANGYAWTNDGWNDGNPVWEYGVDKDGNAIYKALSVYKLVANLIEAGTIQSADGSSFWNLENGNSSFKGTFKNEDDMGNVTYVTHAQEILGLEHYANYEGMFIFDRVGAGSISNPPTAEDLKRAGIGIYMYDEDDGVYGTWLRKGVIDLNFGGDIIIGGNTLADFPIEYGTTNGWTWEKYASGKIKCYCKIGTGTINVNTAYGNIFITGELSIAIPSTILTIKNISHSVYLAGGVGGLTLSNTDIQIISSKTIKYWLWSATALTNKNPQVYFEITGTWK